MKIDASVVQRRTFLKVLLAGWAGGLAAVVGYPATRFLIPPLEKEPEEVRLPTVDFEGLAPNAAKTFPWGAKMGIIVRRDDGSLRAFKGVCTHLTCNVTWRPEKKQFHCPCHEGLFDENGVNIAGPPPRPLEVFMLTPDGSELVVTKEGVPPKPKAPEGKA